MVYDTIYYRPDSNTLFNDRVFWIYFIITLFFIIIGITLIAPHFEMSMIIATLWTIGNLSLMMLIYHISNLWKTNPNFGTNFGTKGWFIINILFIVLLIIGTIWTGEYQNTSGNSELQTMTSILMLLGGLLLTGISSYDILYLNNFDILAPLIFGVFYLIIWFILTLYTLKK